MRIGRAVVVGDERDARYLQRITCGRHALLGDEPPGRGGQDAGPPPFDYLLAALGTCTSITLRMYAERHGWDLGAVTVKLVFDRTNDASRIEREVTVSAPLSEEQHARLAEICDRTPVTLALLQGVAIDTRLRAA